MTDQRTDASTEQIAPVESNDPVSPISALGAAVIVTDRAGLITGWNTGAVRLFGFDEAAALGRSLAELVMTENDQLNALEVVAELYGGGPWTGEIAAHHRDGSELRVLCALTPLFGPDERVTGAVIAGIDVTADWGQRARLQRLAAALDVVPDAIIELDDDGRILSWSRGAERLYGYIAEEVLGQSTKMLVPGDRAGEVAGIEMAASRGVELSLTTVRRRKDGTLVDVSMRITPTRDADGRQTGRIAVVRDVSAEQELIADLRRAEHKQRARFADAGIPQAIVDRGGTVRDASQALAKLLGFDRHEIVGWRWPAASAVLADYGQARRSAPEADLPGYHQSRLLVRRDGSTLPALIALSPLSGESGAMQEYTVVVIETDTVSTDETEDALRMQRGFFRSLRPGSLDGAFMFDATGQLTFVSEAAAAILGYEPNDLVNTSGWDHLHPDDFDRLADIHNSLMTEPQVQLTIEFRLRHKDGHWVWVEETLTNLLDDPDVRGVVAVARDITDRRLAREELHIRARTDALTDLPNRAALLDQADEVLARLDDAGGHGALILLDLDHFKLVNESYGHTAGDLLLVEVARRLRWVGRAKDLLYRTGGDEFAVLVEGVTDAGAAVELGHRLTRALAGPIRLPGGTVFVTASIGVALTPVADAAALLAEADAATYVAKARGRGCIAVSDRAMMSATRRRLELVTDLRTALDSGELAMHYQPIIDLRTTRVTGVEALLRWSAAPVSTAEIIAAAEDSGLSLRLGHWALRTAGEFAARWASNHDRPLRVSVNVSAHELADPGFVNTTWQTLNAAGAPRGSIVLEVTETAVMSDVAIAAAAAVLDQLHELEIDVAIDDFGTGFSSLSRLRQLPVRELKIDQSFVAGLGVNADDSAIVGGVVALARSVGVSVVAEGVENETQLRLLQDLGCERGQGFLWSPAVPEEQLSLVLTTIDSMR